jgi:hypothetical protein
LAGKPCEALTVLALMRLSNMAISFLRRVTLSDRHVARVIAMFRVNGCESLLRSV